MSTPQRRRRGDPRPKFRPDGTIYAYEARVQIDGVRRSFSAPTKTAARALADAARVDASRGIVRSPAAVTVAQHLAAWLARVQRSVRGRTYTAYESHVRRHIVPAIGRIRLSDLTVIHVGDMLAELLHDHGLSEKTVHNCRTTLVTALKAAQLEYGLAQNVASLCKTPRSDRPPFRAEVIGPPEARAILEAMRGSRLEPLVTFSLATGVRQGEALALRWQDIDVAAGTMTIRHAVDIKDGRRILARPKSAKSARTLRLPDMARAALELERTFQAADRTLAGPAWVERDLVFPGPTGDIRLGDAVRRNFQDWLGRRGLPPYRWHALRRVFAAVLQDAGVPLPHIRDLLGHSQIGVTEHYAYTMPGSLSRAMGQIDASLAAPPPLGTGTERGQDGERGALSA